MSTMIERVARAWFGDAWSDMDDEVKVLARQDARAAIEEMREPDVEMIAAFWRQKNCGTQEVGQVGDARSDYDAWRAAIDTALSEPHP